MNNILRRFAALSILLSSTLTFAQTRDRASVVYDRLPEANGVEASQVEVNGNHRVTLDADGESLLTLGVQYRHTYLQSEGRWPAGGNRELQMLVPQISLMRVLNDEYTLIVNARPGFFGDFDGGFGRSFRMEGGALVSRIWNEKLTLGFGVARGSNFGRDLVVPIVQILYLPTPTIMVDALLPVKAEVWYLPSRFWEFGGVFNIVGSLYTVDQPAFAAEELGFANIYLGGAVRRHIVQNLYAHFEAGYTVMRRYQWQTDREELRDIELDGVAYVRAGLNWRF